MESDDDGMNSLISELQSDNRTDQETDMKEDETRSKMPQDQLQNRDIPAGDKEMKSPHETLLDPDLLPDLTAPKIHYVEVSDNDNSEEEEEPEDLDRHIESFVEGKAVPPGKIQAIWAKKDKMYKGLADLGILAGQTHKFMKELIGGTDKVFAKIWSEYHKDYVEPMRDQKTIRGAGFKQIRDAILMGEANGLRTFTNPYLTEEDKAKWLDIQHSARFIAQVFEYYRLREHGFLYGRKMLTDNDCYYWIFNLKKHMQWLSLASRANLKQAAKVRAELKSVIRSEMAGGSRGRDPSRAPTKTLAHDKAGTTGVGASKEVFEKASGRPPSLAHLTRVATTPTDIALRDDIDYVDFDDISDQEIAAGLISDHAAGFERLSEDEYQEGDMARELQAATDRGIQITAKNRYEYRYNAYHDIVGICKDFEKAADKYHHGKDRLAVHSDDIVELDGEDQVKAIHEDLKTADPDIIPFGIEDAELEKDKSDWLRNLFSNKAYQPDDVKGALKAFRIHTWVEPRLKIMRHNISLRWWQLTGAHHIKKLRAKGTMRGMLEADKVGLGKTFTMATVIASDIEDRLHARRKDPNAKLAPAKPYLFIVPPNLLEQTAVELAKFSGHFQLWIYHSKGTATIPGVQLYSKTLKKKNTFFNTSLEVNAQTIIITTYHVLTIRHGPSDATKFHLENKLAVPEKNNWDDRVPDEAWDHSLSGCFGTVFADECQAIKSAGNPMHLAVRWLFPDFVCLISGTPLYAGIRDMGGYLAIIQPSANSVKNYKIKPGEQKFRPWYNDPYALPEGHSGRTFVFFRASFQQYVLKERSPDRQGLMLEMIWRDCLVCRGYSSRCPKDSNSIETQIGAALPDLRCRVIEVQNTKLGDRIYSTFAPGKMASLLIPTMTANGDEALQYNANSFRALTFMSTAPLFIYSSRAVMDWGTEDIWNASKNEFEEHRKPNPNPRNKQDWAKEKHVLRKIMKEIARNKQMENDEAYQNISDWKSVKIPQLLALLVRDSPKIAALMLNIADEVIKRREKALIWTLYPDEQLILRELMSHFGIDARILSSDLSSYERMFLTRSFNEPGGCQVLIASYTANGAGLNLQQQCRNVHLLDPAANAKAEEQAIGRCYRIGQDQEVRVTSYFTRGTFNSYVFSHQIEQLLPGLAAMLERTQLGDDVSSETLLANTDDVFTWIDPNDGKKAPSFVQGKVDPLEYSNCIIEEMNLKRALVKVAHMMKGKSTLQSGGFGPEFSEWQDYIHTDKDGNVQSQLGMGDDGRTLRRQKTPKMLKKKSEKANPIALQDFLESNDFDIPPEPEEARHFRAQRLLSVSTENSDNDQVGSHLNDNFGGFPSDEQDGYEPEGLGRGVDFRKASESHLGSPSPDSMTLALPAKQTPKKGRPKAPLKPAKEPRPKKEKSVHSMALKDISDPAIRFAESKRRADVRASQKKKAAEEEATKVATKKRPAEDGDDDSNTPLPKHSRNLRSYKPNVGQAPHSDDEDM